MSEFESEGSPSLERSVGSRTAVGLGYPGTIERKPVLSHQSQVITRYHFEIEYLREFMNSFRVTNLIEQQST